MSTLPTATLWVLLAGLTTAQAVLAASPPGDGGFDLTILHINDHHSHIEPNRGTKLELGGPGAPPTQVETGGFARVAAKIRALRARHRNVLTLHAGDAITGTVFHSLFKGEVDAAVMNQVCFDALTLGNHEFDDGDAGLARFIGFLNRDPSLCQTPVLAANVIPALGTPLYPRAHAPLVRPYVIKTVGGQRVGIVGITIAGKTKRSSRPLESTQFLDERETAQRQIDALRAQGIDRIILLTHLQYLKDIALARGLRGVDIIIGGDSHSLLGEGFARWGLNPSGPYPTQVTDLDGRPVCIAQAWQYADIVGELRLRFDGQGHLTQCEGTPHLLLGERFEREGRTLRGGELEAIQTMIAAAPELDSVAPDPAIRAVIARYAKAVAALKTTIVGVASEDLCLERVPDQGQSALCDRRATRANGGDIQQLVAAAFLARSREADVAIQNAGSARIDIPAGPISVADVHSLLPFANTLVNLELSGAEIRRALEEAVSGFLDTADGSTGAYPYAANLRWALDLSQPRGRRFSQIEIRRKGETAWRALEDGERVRVVTNSFVAGGADGYATFKTASANGCALDTFIDDAQGFIDYVQQDLGGARAGDPILATPSRVGPIPCADYSTQRFVDASGTALLPDPAVPRACEPR